MNIDTESKDIFSRNQQPLPYATASLVLGILSIVFCFMYGVLGVVLGIIGLVLANKDRALYRLNPDLYSPESYKNSNAGRTCAIIGLIISSLFILLVIAAIVFFAVTTIPFIH